MGSLNGERSDALLNKSVEEVTYSPMLGVAVTRLDPDGVVPVGIGLLLMLIVQGFGRGQAAERNGAKIRGGYFIPSSSLGTLGRTWSIRGSGAQSGELLCTYAHVRRCKMKGPTGKHLSRFEVVTFSEDRSGSSFEWFLCWLCNCFAAVSCWRTPW